MANTYVALAKSVLTSSTATVTFSSIPQTYTDLILLFSTRDDRPANNQNSFSLVINGDTGTNYSNTNVYGYQSNVVYSDRRTSAAFLRVSTSNTLNNTADTFTNGELIFSNYTSTSSRAISLSCVMENNTTTGIYMPFLSAQLYRGTSALSSFVMTPESSASFVSGSSFYLYGINT